MAAAVNASRSGDLLNDRYELSDLVETCETHQLYRARDTRDDRLVTISMLRPEVALRAGVAQRFVQTPQQLTKLDHPNVMRVWSVESDVTGIPFVVEEPRSGQTLASMIEAFPDGMPLGVAVNVLVPIVEATAAAHGRGLVHGALDPKHVLLAQHAGTTVPKIFGFGASDKASKAGDDVHALGALFYRALTGQSAFNKRREPLDELAPHLPLELTELIERCLAGADERPADARLLCDELSSLRQKLGGQRASAVSVERAVAKEQAPARAGAPMPAASVKPPAATQPAATEARRRVVMERAETAPMSAPPPAEPIAIDAHGATCFDVESPKRQPRAELAPQAQPAPEPVARASVPAPAMASEAAALDRSSIDFPMASSRPAAPAPAAARAAASVPLRPAKPDKAQAQAETVVDEPAMTREDRAKGKAKPAGRKAKPQEEPAAQPDIAVAGPARLAAAFSPLEGGPNIEQGETREAELGRVFRQGLEEDQRAREARFGRMQAMAAVSKEVSAAQAKSMTAGAQVGTAPANKPAKREAARPSAAEVIALGQLHTLEEEKRERRSRFVGGMLLMLFCFALARFVPMLVGGKEVAVHVLGVHVKTGMAVFTALAVVVLIKTWALQIQTKALLLKPVTYSLKVVVACSAVLAMGLLMTEGSSLGMVGATARRILPWASAGFFLFLGFYGIMRGLRETQVNMIAGIVMTLAYGGSFVGSYSVTKNVIAPGLRGASQASVAMQVLAQQGAEPKDPKALLEAAVVDPALGAEITEQATVEDGFKQVKESGSGNSDMEAIEEMGAARKRNGAKLGNLSDNLKELAK